MSDESDTPTFFYQELGDLILATHFFSSRGSQLFLWLQPQVPKDSKGSYPPGGTTDIFEGVFGCHKDWGLPGLQWADGGWGRRVPPAWGGLDPTTLGPG